MSNMPDSTKQNVPNSVQRPNAIVHLGLNKTGSSTIQKWLSINSNRFGDQGFYYDGFDDMVRTGCRQVGALALLAYTPMNVLVPGEVLRQQLGITKLEHQRPFADRVEKAFRESVAQAGDKTMLFSSENLGTLARTPEFVAGICNMFDQYFDRVTYVIYVREQADWLLSLYSQVVKTGYVADLERFADRRGFNNYFRIGSMWSDIAGRENVVIRLYDPDCLVNWDVFSDFASVCGIDTRPLKTPPRKNQSLSQGELNAKRFMNICEKRLGLDPKRRTRIKRMIARMFRNKTLISIDPDLAQRVRQMKAETNEKFRKKFFPERDVLFSNLTQETTPRNSTGAAEVAPAPQH